MAKLLIHPNTELAVQAFLKQPGHGLCLVGPAGAGKRHLSAYIAHELLGEGADHHTRVLSPEAGSIGIEAIRQLQAFLRLKQPGSATIRRVAIIEDAHAMTDEAQNAALKMLEEPPVDTLFILTTDGSSTLRPTIYSRVQQLRVLPIRLTEAEQYFEYDKHTVKRAFALSGGYAGLLKGLLDDPDHQLVQAVSEAKTLMNSEPYSRLLEVDRLSKQKEQLGTLFYALDRVVSAVLTNSSKDAARLTKASRAIYQAKLGLAKNANTKLLLTDLFLNL